MSRLAKTASGGSRRKEAEARARDLLFHSTKKPRDDNPAA